MSNMNEKEMAKSQVETSVSKIIYSAIIKDRKNGRHFNVYSLLGYIYKNVADNAANQEVLRILTVEEFDPSVFSSEELDILTKNAALVLEYIFNIAGENTIYSIPRELCTLILDTDRPILHITEGDTIYTPFAGLSDFAAICPNCKFVGEEKESRIWAIGEVRAYFSNKNTKIVCADSLSQTRKYDYIIATPPFGLSGEYAIHKIVDNLYDRLNPGGEMVIMVPTAFLLEQKSRTTRRKLVSEHALSQVVLLPSHLLKNTGIEVAILSIHKLPTYTQYECLLQTENGDVLEKGDLRNEEYQIRMVDYSSFVQDNRKYGTIHKLDIEAIDDAEITSGVKMLMNEKQSSHFSIYVNSTELLSNKGVCLNPKFYLVNNELVETLQPDEKLVPLHDVVTMYSSEEDVLSAHDACKRIANARIINVSDLSNNILKWKSDFLDLEIDDISDRAYTILHEGNLLLVSEIGKELKPTIFKLTAGNQFVVGKYVLPLKVKKDTVSIEYLQCQLTQEYFTKQIEAIRYLDRGMPTFTYANLLQCKIKVVGLNEHPYKAHQIQAEEVHRIREQVSRNLLEQLDAENKALRDSQHNDYVILMRARKHAMGQVLNALDPGLDLILNKIQQYPLSCDTIVSKKSGTTALRQLEKMRKQLDMLISMTNNLTDEHQYGTPEIISVNDFILNYVASSLYENFRFETDLSTNDSEVIQHKLKIDIAPSDLTKVLNNIITNANVHGFTKDDSDYVIRILVEETQLGQKDAVKITVINNGNPLPESFDEERVFAIEQSSSGSTGIGGWEIKRIIEYYGGEVHIKNYPAEDTDGFTVAYIITLPLTNNPF